MALSTAWALPALAQDGGYSAQLAHSLDDGFAQSADCGTGAETCTAMIPIHWDLANLAASPARNELLQPSDVLITASTGVSERIALAVTPDGSSADSPTALVSESDRLDQSEADPFGPLNMPSGLRWADHVPRDQSAYLSFFKQAGTIKTELIILGVYFSAQSGKKLFRERRSFHFHDEDWFGKSTTNLGVDKVLHAYDTYLIAEVLHMRMHKNTGGTAGDALTAGILASGFMALNELSDGIENDSGYSMQDVISNTVGAAFSVLRNTIPGMREKVSFKLEVVPNDEIYSYRGQKHYEQERFLLSLKGAGFKALNNSPFRYLDLQVGYYATDFLWEDRERGKEPKNHLFFGVGLNVGELLFGRSRGWAGKGANLALDYFQIPYTSIRYDNQGEWSY